MPLFRTNRLLCNYLLAGCIPFLISVSSAGAQSCEGINFIGTEYPLENLPLHIQVGDINGDGSLDIAVQDTGRTKLTILLNNGDGTFAIGMTHSRFFYRSFAIGDLDGDGDGDILATSFGNTSTNTAHFDTLMNNGNGGFVPFFHFLDNKAARNIQLADLDQDGDLDLAMTSEYPGAQTDYRPPTTIMSNGDGTFDVSGQVSYPGGIDPYVLILDDLNNNGQIDMAVLNERGGDVSTFLNLGTGSGILSERSSYFAGDFPISFTLGDVDNDGDLDIAVGNAMSSNQELSILRNNGDGTYSAPTFYHTVLVPGLLFFNDIDNDGYQDVVTYSDVFGERGMVGMLNDGSGTFAAPELFIPDTSIRVQGDFDGDGDQDFVGIRESKIVIFINECSMECAADMTSDGSLNFFDISVFMTAFMNLDPIADFTNDGMFNFFDASAFLSAFNTGCP